MKTTLIIALLTMLPLAAFADKTHTLNHDNGQMKWQVKLVGGLPHGESFTWHDNGKIASKGFYLKGKRIGDFEHWDKEGNHTNTTHYQDGKEINLNVHPVKPDLRRQHVANKEIDSAHSTATMGFITMGAGLVVTTVGLLQDTKSYKTCDSNDSFEKTFCNFSKGGEETSKSAARATTVVLGLGLSALGLGLVNYGHIKKKRAERQFHVNVSKDSFGAGFTSSF